MPTKTPKNKTPELGDIELKTVEIESLKPHKDNPRVGNLRKITESIKVNGFLSPIVVQKKSNTILAGNHRVEAARKLGYTTVPALIADIDNVTARKFVLADNKTSDEATYDEAKLVTLLKGHKGVNDLEGSGYVKQEATVIIARAEWQDDEDEDLIIETDEITPVTAEAVFDEITISGPPPKQPSADERSKVLEEIGRRTIYLSIPIKDKRYETIQTALDKAKKQFEVDTNEECIVELLREAGFITGDFVLFDK